MNNAARKKKTLKQVVVAIEPLNSMSSSFPHLNVFASMIKKFQKFHLLPPVMIASLIDNSKQMVPNAWYFKNKSRYASEAKKQIEAACADKFDFLSTHVLKAKSSSNSALVDQLSNYLKKIKSSLLVILSHNRSGLPYYLLGSFAETAALNASTPILVIKPQVKNLAFSAKPRLTVALDPTVRYSVKQMKWIANIAYQSKAQVSLIGVKPNTLSCAASWYKPKTELADKELKKFEQFLIKMGISTSISYVNEKNSIAQTIINFADKTKSWAIITLSVNRKLSQKILLGSTARRVLALTKRPFLSLRLD